MNITVEDAGPCRKVIRIKAEPAEIASDYNELLTSYASAVEMPGFRRGKAPKAMVEKRYAQRIVEDAKEQLVPRIYRKAVDQEGITPVAVVDVKDVAFDKATGLDFNVIIDVAPDFKLPKYKKVSIKAESVAVEDSAVEQSIDDMRGRFARYDDSERTDIQAEDLVQVDFTATLDGAPLTESVPEASKGLAESSDFWMHIGDPEFLPGMNAALTGQSTGAPLSIDITFPEEFAVPDLVGRTATYSVNPKAIRERVLPDLDDAFVKQFDLDSVDAFKARMRENMEEQAQQNEKGRQREDVSKWLIEKTSLELPQSVLEEETRMTARSIVDNVVRSGATHEQIAEQQQVILDTATQTSTNRVKLNYILTRIAEEESLSVTDEEFEKSLAEMAARYNMPPADLLKKINENNGMDRMRSDLLSEKTLDHLLDIAKIK